MTMPADFDGYHLLQIPTEGLYHLYHSDIEVTEEYVKTILDQWNEERDDIPNPARIDVRIDDTECVIWFTPDPTLPVNPRARTAISERFGWHMIFTGCVVIEGLDPESVAAIVGDV